MRIAFGSIMLWEAYQFLSNGWIERYYTDPVFLFKYFGFEWVAPLSQDLMYAHFYILGLLAFCIIVGAFYRITSILFVIGFSYIFLLDQAIYLNHFYMVLLLGTLLAFMPAHRYFSFDAWRNPKIATQWIAAWPILLLCFQMEVIYIYAGIVKINPDWLTLHPLKEWFENRADYPVMGQFFIKDWVVAMAAYGVIALHLIGAPLLLFNKTRVYVFAVYAVFHLLNVYTFNIGIFPWLTLLSTLIFFDPAWPKQLAEKFTRFTPGIAIVGNPSSEKEKPEKIALPAIRQNIIISLLVIWGLFQILVPLRHWLYPGNVAWTQEGHRFAWRMKLRSISGRALFFVHDNQTGKNWRVNNRDYLNYRQYQYMSCRPDMILQFAHYIHNIWVEEKGYADISVKANVMCSLNYRKKSLLIDREIDLATIPRDLWHDEWILPLDEDNKPLEKITLETD